MRAREIAEQIIKNNEPGHLPNNTICELEKEVKAIYRREGVSYEPFEYT